MMTPVLRVLLVEENLVQARLMNDILPFSDSRVQYEIEQVSTLRHALEVVADRTFDVARIGGGLLNQLFWVNVSMVLFNLLPAFPMDGGRVLRALLAMRLDYVRATQVAARIGQGMAILFAFAGLFGIPGFLAANPFLAFIAIFVWIGAAQEASLAQLRAALDGIPVTEAMITDFRALRPDEPLATAVEHVAAGFQADFPVIDRAGRLVGILQRTDLSSALGQYGPDTPVGEVMQREFVTVDPHDMLHTAFGKLQECDCHTLPVVHGGSLLGLLTTDSLSEALMINQALREHRPPRSTGSARQPLGWGPRQHLASRGRARV
jgi:CBS domain-containing protein